MHISRTLLAHALLVGASVTAAVGTAVLTPSTDTTATAITAGLTALSGVLVALKLTGAATVASEVIPAVPALLRVEAAVEPLVAQEWALHRQPAAASKVTGLSPVKVPG